MKNPSKAKFQGVIFDLDGTLADTLEDIADSLNRVLDDRDLPTHDYESYKYFVGKGVRNLVIHALPDNERTEALITQCRDAFAADYQKNYLVKTRLYDGVADLVRALAARGLRLSVLSNKPDEFTRAIVEALLGLDLFEIVMGAQPGIPRKPDPSGAILIGRRMGLPPGQIAYVGDTDVDMITATRAGMFGVGVLWGFRTKAELMEGGARVVIAHPSELLDTIDA